MKESDMSKTRNMTDTLELEQYPDSQVGSSYYMNNVESMLGITASRVIELVQDRMLYAVLDEENRVRFPRAQFIHNNVKDDLQGLLHQSSALPSLSEFEVYFNNG